MNNKLVRKLTDKWSAPGGAPAKGYEMVRSENGLSPCAQSEAVMLTKGMGTMDFEAFWRGSLSVGHEAGLNLDSFTAKILGISVTHSILLRRFNDLSSLSPAIVLNEPERVLGKNWDKVLEFWYFMDSLSDEQSKELQNGLAEKTGTNEYESRKKELKELTEGLDVIVPDLHYLPGISSKPLNPSSLTYLTEEEVLKERPDFKVSYTSNQHKPKYLPDPNNTANTDSVVVVGGYSRGYFGWIAPHDYFHSNFPPSHFNLDFRALQVLFSCATNEIQTLAKGQSYEDLYFCKIIGYDPIRGHTFRKLQRKLKEYKRSLFLASLRFYRIFDNYTFGRLSKDDEVKRAATKEMVEGVLELTEDDILSEAAYVKVQETYEVGKGRFFGSLHVRVPKLGANAEANRKFYDLVQKLKKEYSVQPLSFCDKGGPGQEEGSEWAIRSFKERLRPRFNAPTGYKK